MQLGGAPYSGSPPENVALNVKRGQLTQILSKAGFVSIHIFEETHCGFGGPWSFLVAMKSEISRKRWYRMSLEVDIDIHERIVRTKSGQPALKHFDVDMMALYQVPSKAFESVYCKATPTLESYVRNEGIQSQSVQRMCDKKFDKYLDRHTYEKEFKLDSITRNGESNTNANMNANEITNTKILCDDFYYNEQRLKNNSAIDYENIRTTEQEPLIKSTNNNDDVDIDVKDLRLPLSDKENDNTSFDRSATAAFNKIDDDYKDHSDNHNNNDDALGVPHMIEAQKEAYGRMEMEVNFMAKE